jgi:hypothetical protein
MSPSFASEPVAHATPNTASEPIAAQPNRRFLLFIVIAALHPQVRGEPQNARNNGKFR